MNTDFFKLLFNKQQQKEAVPSNEVIASWASHLIGLLYPEQSQCAYTSVTEIEEEYAKLKEDLIHILNANKALALIPNSEPTRH
jgi:serine O-acetyltransferase